jgi:mannose-6-phosphate isomerase-like protein (cupin superfamily)
MAVHHEKEQTFYVLSGAGMVTVNDETLPVSPGDVIHIPVSAPHTTEAGGQELRYVVFNIFVTDQREGSFAQHAQRVAPLRRARKGDFGIGV